MLYKRGAHNIDKRLSELLHTLILKSQIPSYALKKYQEIFVDFCKFNLFMNQLMELYHLFYLYRESNDSYFDDKAENDGENPWKR